MKKPNPATRAVSPDRGAGKSPNSSLLPLPLFVFLIGAGALVWLIVRSFDKPPDASSKPTTASVASNNVPAAAAPPQSAPADLASGGMRPLPDAVRQKLLGNWQRTDADYAIEIRLIGPDGVTDARYFNPFNQRSINVAKAAVTEQAGAPEFFMELRDVGYPGSTYTLRYNEAADVLEGTYFQAAMQETYNVAFQRMRAQ
jgi:hypothetical protein